MMNVVSVESESFAHNHLVSGDLQIKSVSCFLSLCSALEVASYLKRLARGVNAHSFCLLLAT